MAEFLLDATFAQIVVSGIALCGLTATSLIQCGDKRANKKKAPKSNKASKRSVKSVKGRSKKSLRANVSKQDSVSGSKKSSRKSARSSKKSDKEAVVKSAKAPKQQSSRKSARSSKRSDKEVGLAGVASAKAHTSPVHQVKTPQTVEQSKRDYLSLKSLQETQRATINQKEMRTAMELVNNNGLELHMEPKELRFSEQGGLLRVKLHNPTNCRQAIKIKCSDNAIYRVNPVYGYVEAGQHLNVEVVRQGKTGSKFDKLVIVTAKAPAENTDVKKLFKSAPKGDMPLMVLPLLA